MTHDAPFPSAVPGMRGVQGRSVKAGHVPSPAHQHATLPLPLGAAEGDTPWHAALPPTRSAALARIARVRPAAYARTRNHLDGAVTGLSPYLTHGLVTLPEVLAGVLQHSGPLPVQHKLVFELGWRAYFRHVWAHGGEGIFSSLHTGPRPEADYMIALPADIREARTGVPAIDEAVRTLYATGTLHNHARMWLASYGVHLRHVHWRAGADWLVAHLLDGDLASNHLSWQWVAGTGSHKPYLFNAENVARYAPPPWHSPGSVVDCGYDALDRAARAPRPLAGSGPVDAQATPEPPLLAAPPAGLPVQVLDAASAAAAARRLQGREVWLLHPWALRPPPAEVPPDVVCVGLYPQEHHAAHPWPASRWQWVDAAMAAVAGERWYAGDALAAAALAGAVRVRSVADPHVLRALGARAAPASELDGVAPAAEAAVSPAATLHRRVDWLPEPALFAELPRRCSSFSQWWTRVTRGLHDAQELLA